MEKHNTKSWLGATLLAIAIIIPQAAWAAKFSWNLPTTRQDGSSLSASEIAEAEVLISTTAGNYSLAQSFKTAGAAASLDVTTLGAGSYYAVVRVADTGGRKSGFSNEVQFNIAMGTPTPSSSPTPTPTLTPIPNPNGPDGNDPNKKATPTPTLSGKFVPSDFDGNGLKDIFKSGKSRYTVKLSNEQGEGKGKTITGKIGKGIANTMIGYGRFKGIKTDKVVYLRLPLTIASSKKTTLEWVQVDQDTGVENILFKFGKFGDTPIFGCYDSTQQSTPIVLRKLANGKMAALALVDGKSKKTVLPTGAIGATCKIGTDGASTIEASFIKNQSKKLTTFSLKIGY